MRLNVDGLDDDLDDLRRNLDVSREAGLQHVLSAPRQRSLDDWLRSVERLWSAFRGAAG
jgi:hypothetical protein